jgi:hypothetical protein
LGNRLIVCIKVSLFTTLLKSYEWKYEKEWRLCHTNHEYGNPEYGEVPKPTAIYLGATIKNENQKEIIDYANSNRISVYKMRLSSRKYELLAEKLL